MRQMIVLGLVTICLTGCGSSAEKRSVQPLAPAQTSVFTCSDKSMESAYNWAKKMALSYVHEGNDPVGCWYEAALPQREAFCMRDVSHQAMGAHILGLAKHNKNMFRCFAENISEEKDWCTYWEINRYNKPAPADYTDDTEFWYNLNANFDVIQACMKIYEWTGDTDYLTDSCFTYFYDKSVKEYIKHWSLEPENIMNRPRYMNQPEDFNPNNNFHTCRGLPSYVENFRGLTLGVDLLAAMYAGFNAYADMAGMKGNQRNAQEAREKAKAYRAILDGQWWDDKNSYYQTFWTEDRTFHRGEGVPFILWFNATDNKDRIRASVKDILQREWNVENMSAFPVLFYRLGYWEEAYRFLVDLPHMNRSEYPEVSYGIVEGTVCGAMGVMASARNNSVSTCSRLPEEVSEAKISNVPVFDGHVTVKHHGRQATEIENNTAGELIWKVAFVGEYPQIKIGDKSCPAVVSQDIYGNIISECSISLPANSCMRAEI